MKVFYLGANIHQEALDIIESSTDSIVVYEKEDIGLVQPSIKHLATSGRALCINEREVLTGRNSNTIISNEERESILSTVLNDYRLFLLRTRFNRFDFVGAFAGLCYFSDIVDYALFFHEKHKPKLVYCSYTPHTLEAWVFMATLEAAGVRIIRLISSPLPWILLPVTGLSCDAKPVLMSNQRPGDAIKLENYLLLLRDSYEVAMPYYERISKIFKINQLLSAIINWRPRKLIASFEKMLVLREFKASITPFDKSMCYSVYFLHYQPEMNTIPEAGIYCDQYQAIKKLSSALPDGMKLIVKEHPSTFSKRCDRRWRPQGFYKRIADIPNVQMCPPDLNTYQIIDSSKFVASIAGVCLTEAMARGIPVVTFYSPRFNHFPKNVVVDASRASLSDLRTALKVLVTIKGTMLDQEAVSCLEEVVKQGYDGSDDETYIPKTREQASNNTRKANCLAVNDIINELLI